MTQSCPLEQLHCGHFWFLPSIWHKSCPLEQSHCGHFWFLPSIWHKSCPLEQSHCGHFKQTHSCSKNLFKVVMKEQQTREHKWPQNDERGIITHWTSSEQIPVQSSLNRYFSNGFTIIIGLQLILPAEIKKSTARL